MVGNIDIRVVRGPIVIAVAAALAIVIAASCGSDDDPPPFNSIAPGPHVLRADDTFTKESFIGAGWKEFQPFLDGKSYGATSAWYGFFNQKDIYLLFYETNEGATGNEPKVLETLNNFRSDTIPSFYDYLIVGNVVVVCELEIAVCQAMADEL